MRRYVAVLLAISGLLGVLVLRRPKQPAVLLAGTNQSPQFNYRDEQGKIKGFAVDVLEEAAKRAGYRLEWKFVDGAPDVPLANGTVDIWPILSRVEERSRLIYMTRPWWKSDGALMTRADRPIRSWTDLRGAIVRYSPAERYLMQSIRWPAGVQLVMDATSGEAMRRVCAGNGAGVWTLLHLQRELALRRPDGCQDIPLASFQPPDATLPYAIGANKGKEHDAEKLRDAIEDMNREGKTMEIAAHWRILDAAHSDLVAHMVASHRRNLHLLYGLIGVVLLSLVLAIVTARARLDKLTAERMSATRSQFLANMSHELRTPMNGVLGIIDLMMSSNLTGEQRDQLLLARSSARSLLGVLNDILDFSRIDSGKLMLEAIPFSPREVAERSARLLAGKAHAKRLELIFDPDRNVPEEIIGDPVRLQQVLLNLLGNAVKFTSTGYVRLSLRCELKGEHVWLAGEVSDTGIGIPREKQTAIFESFTQADATTTRKYGGSGLGLTISSRLAAMMHGELTLSSEEGKGSRFHFTGRFGRMPDEELPEPPARTLRGKLALVVDDNPESLELIRNWMAEWHMEVTTVERGPAAVDLVKAGRNFDFVIVDTRLSVNEDGFSIARRLGDLAGRERLLLLLETLDLGGDVARCRQAGAHAYLTKPLSPWELERKLLEMTAPDETCPPTQPMKAEPPPSIRLSILVAEDNRINQLVTRKLLEKAGHQVRVVENGREALAALEESPFDVALFDMQMPEMGGVEAVGELRRREQTGTRARTPVIAVTAHALTGDRDRFLEAGIDDYLAKPIDAASLLSMIDRVTGHSMNRA